MAARISTILAATSIESPSDEVLQAALTLRRSTGARLELVHAFAGTRLGLALGPEQVESQKHQRTHSIVEQLIRLGARPNEVNKIRVHAGSPHRVLLAAARDLGPDLLLVGATESTGPLAQMLGSTADRVLRKALWPTLVVRGELRLPPYRVLAPVDLSALSEEALKRGLGIMLQLGKEHEPPVEAMFVLAPSEREGQVEISAAALDELAQGKLENFAERVSRSTGCPLSVMLSNGAPREVILDRLGREEHDLVILGTHGGSGFERLLVGGVTAAVVRRAPCSVLVIPPLLARVEEEEKATTASGAMRALRLSGAWSRIAISREHSEQLT